MNKTVFHISKMDCLCEETLIRIKLEPFEEISQLDFDISNRLLVIYHTINEVSLLESTLAELHLNSKLVSSEHVLDGVILNVGEDVLQRKLLKQVLAINFFFFVAECVVGLIANSMGLIADSLDMLADSFVYILALWAIGANLQRKQRTARIAGYTQLVLAVLGLVELMRHFSSTEIPRFEWMILVSSLALIGNVACIYLLQKSKSKDVHMKASLLFTSNDVIVNLGVILAGILVYVLESNIPDLIIGSCVFIIVCIGALRILRIASK